MPLPKCSSILSILAGLLALALPACFAPLKQIPGRTGIDQQVTSSAVRACAEQLDLRTVDHRKLYSLEVSAPRDTDVDFIRACVQARLIEEGIKVGPPMLGRSKLEVVVAFAASDLETTLIGIPLVVPGFAVSLGDLSLYKSSTQTGRAKMAIQTWDETGTLMARTPDAQASRYFINETFLTFIGTFDRTNIEDFREPGDENEDDPSSEPEPEAR